MKTPRSISLFFLVLLLAVSSVLYYPRYQAAQRRATQLAAVLADPALTGGTSLSDQNAPVAPLSLDERIKTTDCGLQPGASPDHACTPGAVFTDVPLDVMCTPGYTKKVRSVSTKTRKAVYAEYGIAYPQPTGTYEVDHLIPLAIGGDNEIANLFPQPASPPPGFKEKDLVEVYLREEVCAGRVDRTVAQVRIADDWLSIYNNLSPDDITRLKSLYRSWSN